LLPMPFFYFYWIIKCFRGKWDGGIWKWTGVKISGCQYLYSNERE
jgi:hypothetical protein